MKNNIILIGSSGFVGRNVKKFFLKKKIKCIYLSTKNFNLSKIKKKTFKEIFIKNSVIIYAAGKHRKFGDTIKLKNYNIKIFKNLLDNLKNSLPKKIIFLSTVEVYGKKKKSQINESSKLNPLNLYAKGKLIQERELKKFSKKNKINYNILRLPGFYGKDDKNSIISKLYSHLQNEEKIYFKTDGSELRDYIYINDLVKIIYLFIKNYQRNYNGIFNIVQGKSYKLKQYLFILKKNLNSKKDLVFGKEKGFDLKFNNQKLRSVIKKNSFKFLSHKVSISKEYK